MYNNATGGRYVHRAPGARRGDEAIQRSPQLPPARREHAECMLLDYEALYDICFRTLKLTTPTRTNRVRTHAADVRRQEHQGHWGRLLRGDLGKHW